LKRRNDKDEEHDSWHQDRGAVAGKLVNAKVRREVERALEAYPDADQLILNIARKYADRVLMQ
jgi:hypothetical protein